ncbi:hypothetical protein [Rheinheimera sp. 1928-s]|uniref:hypothetical protein n=1 Tax=Rheinheimera sp. 1928-s TaxID=3033803 RepID=UPI00260B06CC|nr:hypothetical protein [Rheinheimera sp. 1928-s]MDF3126846.1 hypothetical protein [Rheinheimera sp. 1928-s]
MAIAWLFCLVGCEPALEHLPEQQLMDKAQQGHGAAAVLLAKKRQQQGDIPAALNWYQKALDAGLTHELAALLALKQRQDGFLATASYLEHRLQQQQSVNAAEADLATDYGLWHYVQSPAKVASNSDSSCSLTLQPVVQSKAGSRQLQLLQQQWQQDPQLSSLAVCFLPEKRMNSTDLQCSYQAGQRIQCQYQVLTPDVAKGGFSQLLVVAGEGTANYNNGIVQLAESSSFEVFRHEFAHILGFMDEYSLSTEVAQTECRSDKIRPNLLTDKTQLDIYLQHWQLEKHDVQLQPVESCDNAGVQAYAPVSNLSFMRSHEAQVPDLYIKLMQKVLAKPELIMPVQYFYAYLARQEQDWYHWRLLMDQAAKQGYPDALHSLQEASAIPTAP